MKNKHRKPYWEMTTSELREATKEFDRPNDLPAVPPPVDAAAQLRRARRGRPRIGKGAAKIRISMERGLLKQADSFARKEKMTRSQLIAEGVKSLIRSAS